jgi:flavin reductase (DIM6/NTAB) family NADH-FMN oxidoreductase RutF
VITTAADTELVDLSTATPIWERFFTVAPLVLVGTKERDGYDLAPKHLAVPLGWENYFGFVCTPRHATLRNLLLHPEFTVSFPGADRILDASFSAGGRQENRSKPTLAALPTFPARTVDGVLVGGCALYLECVLDRLVDGFGENSLVVQRAAIGAARHGRGRRRPAARAAPARISRTWTLRRGRDDSRLPIPARLQQVVDGRRARAAAAHLAGRA